MPDLLDRLREAIDDRRVAVLVGPHCIRLRLRRLCDRIIEPRYEDCSEYRLLRDSIPVLMDSARALHSESFGIDVDTNVTRPLIDTIDRTCASLQDAEYPTYYDTMVRLEKLRILCGARCDEPGVREQCIVQETRQLIRELRNHIEEYRIRGPASRLLRWARWWIYPPVVEMENGVPYRPTFRSRLSNTGFELYLWRQKMKDRRRDDDQRR